jgi:hypothetical protein
MEASMIVAQVAGVAKDMDPAFAAAVRQTVEEILERLGEELT